MMITFDKLEELNACEAGLVWFGEHYGAKKEADISQLCSDLIADNKDRWAIWWVLKNLDEIDCVKLSVFAARLVLSVITDAKILHVATAAINSAEKYIKEPNDKNARAAARAARAAADDANAANAAANAAAYDAAYDAADGAVRDAADGGVRDAATAAARAVMYAGGSTTAYKETYKKIIDYGISLIKNENGDL